VFGVAGPLPRAATRGLARGRLRAAAARAGGCGRALSGPVSASCASFCGVVLLVVRILDRLTFLLVLVAGATLAIVIQFCSEHRRGGSKDVFSPLAGTPPPCASVRRERRHGPSPFPRCPRAGRALRRTQIRMPDKARCRATAEPQGRLDGMAHFIKVWGKVRLRKRHSGARYIRRSASQSLTAPLPSLFPTTLAQAQHGAYRSS
jgi:hypothetical protein